MVNDEGTAHSSVCDGIERRVGHRDDREELCRDRYRPATRKSGRWCRYELREGEQTAETTPT